MRTGVSVCLIYLYFENGLYLYASFFNMLSAFGPIGGNFELILLRSRYSPSFFAFFFHWPTALSVTVAAATLLMTDENDAEEIVCNCYYAIAQTFYSIYMAGLVAWRSGPICVCPKANGKW